MALSVKVLVVVAALVLGVFADPPEPFQAEIEECRKQFNIEPAALKSGQPLPADKKCFHRCVAQKTGLMDANGALQVAAFKTKLQSATPPASAEMIASIDKCTAVKLPDPCDQAEAICKCMHGK